ncbi:MAG: hypothetical protein EON49_22040 [Acidovorax sp.]|nr:MAG: hypothetical protein EON49_22040 [Acidovorax sp.]
MNLTIRPAQTADANAIARIHVAAWQAAYAGIIDAAYLAAMSAAQREGYWAQAIAQGAPEVLLAQDDSDGAVAGWIALGDCRDPGAPATHAPAIRFYTRQGFAPDADGVKSITVAGATLQELRYTALLASSGG